jgi:predicted transcriptional regulator
MTDSLKVYDILKGAQIPELQARAITNAIRTSEETSVLNAKSVLDERFPQLATKEDLALVKVDLAEVKAELIPWMFVFWVGQMATTAGIVFAGLRVWK